ncbi:hypothetical protein PGT21_023229 [Puccinia graminis f. sp. tritici]|uniref:Uncharacterized protein n=1 Tax=Puccinia graminis f. sp. tritici TaxID=56615 RepID=A0A5B0QBZ3_PUCGR|nr:hypothetical protein PGT21_023229 [Puccinia graminis f. sp. tritici]
MKNQMYPSISILFHRSSFSELAENSSVSAPLTKLNASPQSLRWAALGCATVARGILLYTGGSVLEYPKRPLDASLQTRPGSAVGSDLLSDTADDRQDQPPD